MSVTLHSIEDVFTHETVPVYPLKEYGETIEYAERVLNNVYRRQDIPLNRQKVYCMEGKYTNRIDAQCCVVGATVHRKGIPSFGGKWEITGQPKQYALIFDSEKIFDSHDPADEIVRHELAHAINFELDGYTKEQHGNHKEWLDKLRP